MVSYYGSTDFEWIAIALGDVAWIALAFILGLFTRTVGLPPLVGFLATGFILNVLGITSGEVLRKLADLGITLLLFTVGLKLNLRTFTRSQVWAVTTLHMAIVVIVFGTAIYFLALSGIPFLSSLNFSHTMLIAFALSFSSTVLVVKVLEDKGEIASLHGRIAVGILIVQDLAAVVFLAISIGKWPSIWSFLVLLLIPLRPLLIGILGRVGHGELLVLYGLVLALGGAEVFELVGLKGDIGALVLGVLIAGHTKADELAKTMLGFKDLFLLGFFLSIGLYGPLTMQVVLAGAAITPFVILKSVLFFVLLTRFKLRARTSLLASLNLTNYSEFGLIVIAISAANGWIDGHWLIVIAIALSLSCAVSAGLNVAAHRIYDQYRTAWSRFQRPERLADDGLLDIGGATVVIIGMGRIGTAAYDHMHQTYSDSVVGMDLDSEKVQNHQSAGRVVLLGDPGEADFWERVQETHTLKMVMLALPNISANLAVLDQLKAASFEGEIAATVRYHDEIEPLEKAGASIVFNVYSEAGTGFSEHISARFPPPNQSIVNPSTLREQ